MNKFVRTPGQVEELLREYKNEIKNIEKILDTETDLKRRACLQEILMENKEALNNLNSFLNDNEGMFR